MKFSEFVIVTVSIVILIFGVYSLKDTIETNKKLRNDSAHMINILESSHSLLKEKMKDILKEDNRYE